MMKVARDDLYGRSTNCVERNQNAPRYSQPHTCTSRRLPTTMPTARSFTRQMRRCLANRNNTLSIIRRIHFSSFLILFLFLAHIGFYITFVLHFVNFQFYFEVKSELKIRIVYCLKVPISLLSGKKMHL